jgi:hypothetical protein
MKNANIIDFVTYLDEHRSCHPQEMSSQSKELIDAIETLIKRLREHNPMKYQTKADR